ncbi:hypothetical protein G0U57_019864, partial [Chelydra serpentina]
VKKTSKKHHLQSPPRRPSWDKASPGRSSASLPALPRLNSFDTPGSSGAVRNLPAAAAVAHSSGAEASGFQLPASQTAPFGTAMQAVPSHASAPDPLRVISAFPGSAPTPAELAGSQTTSKTPVQRTFSSQHISLTQPSPHRGASALQFTQSDALIVSPTLQSPFLKAYLSPNAQTGSEQPSSSEEGDGFQEDFSPYDISHPLSPINRGQRNITSSYPQDPAPWCVNPWMVPLMPFPLQWQYWAPWPPYSQDHAPSTRSGTGPAPRAHRPATDPRHLAAPSPVQDQVRPAPNQVDPVATPDEVLLPPPQPPSDDFVKFQDLFKRVASELRINLEEVPEQQHELTDILQPPSSSRIVLLINPALLEPAKAIWQTLAASLPTCKRADRKYFIPPKGSEFLFTHLAPNSLVVDTVNQKNKHQSSRFTPADKDSKRLDLFGRKVYASSTLQFQIANYTAVLAKYDHKNYNKFMDFI